MLEAEMKRVADGVAKMDADIRSVQVDLAAIKATMASKGFIVAVVLASLAVIAALIAFQSDLQNWLSLSGPDR